MSWSPANILFTLVGGLLLAAILGWVRKPRLILLVPKLFSHSALSTKGQLAEVSLLNRGFKTEESIEVTLNPNLKYEMVGSNSQDAIIAGSQLKVARIGPGDEVTAILLVEGGQFSSSDISNCLSKETKGKTVSKLEDVPPTGPQRIALVGMVIVFPALLYLLILVANSYFSKELKTVTTEATQKATANALEATQSEALIEGWKIPNIYVWAKGVLYQAYLAKDLTLAIGIATRSGDQLRVPVVIKNSSTIVIRGKVTMNSVMSEGRIPSYELTSDQITILPGESKTVAVKVVVPPKVDNPYKKQVDIEVFLRDSSGDSLKVLRTYTAE